MNVLHFAILGTPIAKGRPRFTRRGFAFTPAKTRSAEADVQMVARGVMAACSAKPLTGPVVVDIEFCMPITASWTKIRKAEAAAGSSYPMGKPDLDNMEKLILDSFNGIVWIDDGQVVTKTSRKVFGSPMTTVRVWSQA